MQFQCKPGAVSVFRVDLSQDVASSELVNAQNQILVFVISQPAEGGKKFEYPPNFRRPLPAVDDSPNAVSIHTFVFDAGEVLPISQLGQ
jgi:hypothetical protein